MKHLSITAVIELVNFKNQTVSAIRSDEKRFEVVRVLTDADLNPLSIVLNDLTTAAPTFEDKYEKYVFECVESTPKLIKFRDGSCKAHKGQRI